MTEIVTRKEAKERGLKRYFTGEPCTHGHVAERKVGNAGCLECHNLRGREAWEAGGPVKERRRQTIKKWREGNKEAYLAIMRKYNNSEKGLNRKNRYRGSERGATVEKGYRDSRRTEYNNYLRNRRARKTNAEGSHTVDDLATMRAVQNDACVYCGVKLGGKGHWDHKIPLSRGGSNWPTNMQLTCQPCNDSKGTLTDEEFRESWRYERRLVKTGYHQ